MLLKLMKMYIQKKSKETPKIYVEDLFYKRDVYPFYICTQASFNYCMKNALLKRKDILEFKEKLDKCVNVEDYKREKFKNDCHEIYRKLKSTCISAKEMQMLNNYLLPFIEAEPKKIVYGHLTVVK